MIIGKKQSAIADSGATVSRVEMLLKLAAASACAVLASASDVEEGYGYDPIEEIEPYEEDVDCVVSDWAHYTQCTNKCGGGTYTRMRDVLVPQKGNGKPCGQMLEVLDCNMEPCPEHCDYGDWGSYGDCTRTCGGGIQYKSPIGGVTERCPEAEKSCNDNACPDDCVMSDWSDWSVCSETCGTGVQTRNRKVEHAPSYGGKSCSFVTSEEQDCHLLECPVPVDCEMAWGSWGECDKTCGGGYQTRQPKVLKEATYGGKDCEEHERIEEDRTCNTDYCPVDCITSEWEQWGSCSEECGEGVQRRERTIVQQPAFNGRACPYMHEEKNCYPKLCPCDYLWSDWSECSRECGGGQQYRTATVVKGSDNTTAVGGSGGRRRRALGSLFSSYHPSDQVVATVANGLVHTHHTHFHLPGQPAIGAKTTSAYVGTQCEPQDKVREDRECNTDYCAVDCELSCWGDWGDCSEPCGEGVRVRTRYVKQQTQHGGKACGTLKEEGACFVNYCPVDCEHEWDEWEQCSATCGGGFRSRLPRVVQKANYGGKDCPAQEEEPCNTDYCPVDCEYKWGDWSECSEPCGPGVQYRKMEITVQMEYDGQACPSDDTEEKQCQLAYCPVDCEHEWGEWGECSYSCGGGFRTRTPKVVTASQYGGKECPSEEDETCNTQKCPIDCEYSPWDDWGSCSEVCGEGYQYRLRTVLKPSAYGGNPCGTLSEERNCLDKPCPVDCEHEWGEWGECSKTCGGGFRSRASKIKTEASGGGKECPNEEEEDCNTDYCPLDCETSEWSDWTKCSEPCGGGYQEQTRSVYKPDEYNGKSCGALRRERNCNDDPCAVDCRHEWGQWGECSMTCGGGYQTREPKVIESAIHGGKQCPEQEEQECNTEYCPRDCVSEWEEWSECTATCGEATRTRLRKIVSMPAYGGDPCGHASETESCPYEYCPTDVYEEEKEEETQEMDCEARREWSDWGECSVTCGGGYQTRIASVRRLRSLHSRRRHRRRLQTVVSHAAPSVYHTAPAVYHTAPAAVYHTAPAAVYHTAPAAAYHTAPAAAYHTAPAAAYRPPVVHTTGYTYSSRPAVTTHVYTYHTAMAPAKVAAYQPPPAVTAAAPAEVAAAANTGKDEEEDEEGEECKPITERQVCNTDVCPNNVVGYDDDTDSAAGGGAEAEESAVEVGYTKKKHGHKHHHKNMFAVSANHKKTVPVVQKQEHESKHGQGKVIHIHRKHISHVPVTEYEHVVHHLTYHPVPARTSVYASDGRMESTNGAHASAQRSASSHRISSSSASGASAAAFVAAVGVAVMAMVVVVAKRGREANNAAVETPAVPAETTSVL